MGKRFSMPAAPMSEEAKLAELAEIERLGIKKKATKVGATAQEILKAELERSKAEVAKLRAELDAGQGDSEQSSRLKDAEKRLSDATSRIEVHTQTTVKRIISGMMSVGINPDQIIDEVNSDRLDGWLEDPEFVALRENIRLRGQTQPIRVRPVDARWQPSPSSPEAIGTDDKFVVQSGRRRLAVCKELGIPVLAVIVTDAASALGGEGVALSTRAADLEERFAENTMRQDLSMLEELFSIGEIANQLREEGIELSQRALAERLGVTQPKVSHAHRCLANRERILAELGRDATWDQVREWCANQQKEAGIAKGRVPEKAQVAAKRTPIRFNLPGAGLVVVAHKGKKMTVAAKGVHVPPHREAEFQERLQGLLVDYIGNPEVE